MNKHIPKKEIMYVYILKLLYKILFLYQRPNGEKIETTKDSDRPFEF